MSQHRNNNKPKFNEWYTPDYVFKIINELMEDEYRIDVDMFTSEQANQRIGATHIFTQENPWETDVAITVWGQSKLNGWCNPPYLGHNWPNAAVEAIVDCMEYGVFANCFLILNANMETAYSQYAMRHAKAMFFFNKRLSFIDARTGEPQKNNNKGQVLYYFGKKQLSSQFTNDDGTLIHLR